MGARTEKLIGAFHAKYAEDAREAGIETLAKAAGVKVEDATSVLTGKATEEDAELLAALEGAMKPAAEPTSTEDPATDADAAVIPIGARKGLAAELDDARALCKAAGVPGLFGEVATEITEGTLSMAGLAKRIETARVGEDERTEIDGTHRGTSTGAEAGEPKIDFDAIYAKQNKHLGQ